jgi:hypothetical protein
MATFNTMAVFPTTFASTQALVIWPSVQNLIAELAVAPSVIGVVWPTEQEPLSVYSTFLNEVSPSAMPRAQYADGYIDGELFGFSSQHEETMEPIQLGETDDDKKTVSFRLYTTIGSPASGLTGDGPVCVPAVGEVQVNRDLAGYVNSAGTFSHVADGEYRYTFLSAEVASGGGEGNTWLRVKVAGFRTVVLRVPIRNLAPTANAVRDAVLNAVRSGFVTSGTIGEGIAIAASLLQGNYYMDAVINSTNGQTAARLRCFHTGIAVAAATDGGTGEGEFATFLVSTTYSGPNKIIDHRVVQQ